jgi:serine protease AprX
LTPDQVKAALMLTAFKGLQQYATITDPTTGQTFNEQADVFTVGAGYLDIQAALANTNLAPPTVGSALSPFAVEGPNGNVALVVNGPSVLGSKAVLLGTDSTAGEAVLWGTGSTTGEAVLWGTGTAAGEAVLWGTGSTASEAVLWGTGSTAGTAVLWGTGSALDQAVAVLWGTSSLQANSVLWGTKN